MGVAMCCGVSRLPANRAFPFESLLLLTRFPDLYRCHGAATVAIADAPNFTDVGS